MVRQVNQCPFFLKQLGMWRECEKRCGTYAINSRRKTKIVYADGRSFDYASNWGGKDAGVAMEFVGKKDAGDFLDGKQHHQLPEQK